MQSKSTTTPSKFSLILKYFILLNIGGLIYVGLEHIWRGYSHWTMYLLGGICFICLGLINEIMPWDYPLIKQMIVGGLIITALEFITGCIVNLWLGWDVWDYSDVPLNILGQISVPSTIGWIFLSLIGIVLDDWIRYLFFGEEKPHYKIFK